MQHLPPTWAPLQASLSMPGGWSDQRRMVLARWTKIIREANGSSRLDHKTFSKCRVPLYSIRIYTSAALLNLAYEWLPWLNCIFDENVAHDEISQTCDVLNTCNPSLQPILQYYRSVFDIPFVPIYSSCNRSTSRSNSPHTRLYMSRLSSELLLPRTRRPSRRLWIYVLCFLRCTISKLIHASPTNVLRYLVILSLYSCWLIRSTESK